MSVFAAAPRIFSIPASAAFLDELAAVLVAATDARTNPEALADALIFTPNQRSSRELALALYRAMDNTLLAPDIRALGDMEDEDTLAAFGPDALELPPAIPPAARRGALARLVQFWRMQQTGGDPLPPASLLAAADELASLIDQGWLAGGADWSRLEGLAAEIAPHLSAHWQDAAGFLDIVMKAWPQHLADTGQCDVQHRRLAAAEALARRWLSAPPPHPVVIAGSTGAGAATRTLMRAVLQLPKGLVVLPGLDADMTDRGWKAVAEAASHPQFTLRATLAALGLRPADVRPWPSSAAGSNARRRLVNEALAPAVETQDWTRRLAELALPGQPADLVNGALAGLSLIEAEDESEEALVAALLLRETLETPDRTAALVTPEASLARRAAALLQRWGVDLEPSSGQPLSLSATGSFLSLLSRWVLDPSDPVLLLAVLKHPHAGLRDRAQLDRIVGALERAALRGPRRSRTLEDLARRLEASERAQPAAAKLVRDLDAAHYAAFPAFADASIDAGRAAEHLGRLAETLATSPAARGERIWAGPAGALAAQLIDQLTQLAAAMGPVPVETFRDFVDGAMQRCATAPDAPEHPRIAIWGPLEARLQRRDRMILASLNEGSWPKPAPADAFLNRALRRRIGLPDPDERVGLSAHDFAQFANAPEVILLRAKRVDDKPAVASRWLWRLRTLAAGGLGGTEAADAALAPPANANPLDWARALRHAATVESASAPEPRPPVAARALNKFSPSRVVTLIRDPYADYARRVLRLEPLRRVGEDIDARERGTAVHEAVEAFEKPDNERALDDLITSHLKDAGAEPELIELEKPLWLRAGRAYLRWSAQREHHRVDFVTEQKAAVAFNSPSVGEVTLEAKADRIDLLADGTLAIIDFKTGQPKKAKQVESGLEPQLPLEAAIAARAAFGRIGPGDTSELIYFRMSLSARTDDADNGAPLVFKSHTTMQVAEQAFAGLQRLVEQYADPSQSYYSKPRVEFIWSISDYDRLARRGEWSADEGGEA